MSAKTTSEKIEQAAVAKRAPTLADMIEKQKEQIGRALPKHVDSDRFVRIALSQVKNPRSGLQSCDPMSVIVGLMDAAQLGLEVDGVQGQAYLVPRRVGGKQVATFQIGWQGYKDLAFRAAGITVAADTVREGDHFRFSRGTEMVVEHVPDIDSDDSPIRAFYAVAEFPDGRKPFEVKSMRWMEEFRDRFAASKHERSPWVQHFEAMAHKTMIRRLLKTLPLSAEIRQAVAADERPYVDPSSTVRAVVDADPDMPDALDDIEELVDAEVIDPDGEEE